MRLLRDAVESLRIALHAIRANKTRGVLTTLGIIIGIVAVVTTMTAANGLANNFRESVSVLGTDVPPNGAPWSPFFGDCSPNGRTSRPYWVAKVAPFTIIPHAV